MSERNVRLGETHIGWNEAKSVTTYTTTDSKILQEITVASGSPVVLESGSVTTVVYNLK